MERVRRYVDVEMESDALDVCLGSGTIPINQSIDSTLEILPHERVAHDGSFTFVGVK